MTEEQREEREPRHKDEAVQPSIVVKGIVADYRYILESLPINNEEAIKILALTWSPVPR